MDVRPNGMSEPAFGSSAVCWYALTALSALLDLALKDQTPSAALLSGASRASHDQNQGEMSRQIAMRLWRRPGGKPFLFRASR
jgi:hypothetical protein